MLTPPPYAGSFDELRERWREIRPRIAHEALPLAFDSDGTLHLGVRGSMRGRRRRDIEFAVRCAIAALDGIAVRRVRCRKIAWVKWEAL